MQDANTSLHTHRNFTIHNKNVTDRTSVGLFRYPSSGTTHSTATAIEVMIKQVAMDHMIEHEFSSATTLQPAHGGGQTGGCCGQTGQTGGIWPQPAQPPWLEQMHGGGGGGGGGGCGGFSQHWHGWLGGHCHGQLWHIPGCIGYGKGTNLTCVLGSGGLGFSGFGLGLQFSQTQHASGLGLQCSQQHGSHGLGGGGGGGFGAGGGHTSTMMISLTTLFPALHHIFLQSFSGSNFPRTTTTFFSFLSSNSTFSMQNSSASIRKEDN